MAFTLGTDAERLRLVVQYGLGWWATLTNPDGPWPEGSAVTLEFLDGHHEITDRWEAEREGDSFMFAVSDAETSQCYDGQRVRLLYAPDPALAPLVWAAGEVSVHGD